MRSVLLFASLLSAAPAGAQDTWSDPFPGVRRLHRRTSNQNVNALVVDLCAAGVSVRATASGERRRTPSSFGGAVGAQAAVNGDFFSYETYGTDGLSAHAGEVWPGTGDHGYVGPVAFGPGRAEIVPHEAVGGPEPWMQEIVSGHPTILVGGAIRDHSGDPLCANRHPRTILGLSADRARLFVAVVDGRASSRIGMTCVEEAQLMLDLGASDAVNMDGGGSSAMWLAGPGVVTYPSDGRERTVANHLAIYATGSGEAAHCPNFRPRGYLDAADCDGVRGWAQDPDEPERAIDVHLYFGGPAGDPAAHGRSVAASVHRDDLCAAIGSCAHGFSTRPPRAFMDGAPHAVHAYGIDTEGGHNPELGSSPRMLTCDPPALPLAPPDGVLRHVPSHEVMSAWGFAFAEVAPVGDAALAPYEEGRPWGGAIELVRVEGEDAVYVVDGEYRRHVETPDVMAAWGFAADRVRVVGMEELDALTLGAPWRPEPFLVQGGGPQVYVVDAVDPAELPELVDGGAIAPPDAGSARDGGGAPPGGSHSGALRGTCRAAPGRTGTPLFALLAIGAAIVRRRRQERSAGRRGE